MYIIILDGTCIRDFIHVVDLAKGHVKSIKILNTNKVHIYII
jgi:UDP-glucose 4-epimerase